MDLYPSWLKIENGKLNQTNSTNYKTIAAVRMWTGTFFVFALCQLLKIEMQEHIFDAWLFSLALLSGISAYQYNKMRTTDYGYVERKQGVAPGSVNVTATMKAAHTSDADEEGTGA
jgi:hypothetical protein